MPNSPPPTSVAEPSPHPKSQQKSTIHDFTLVITNMTGFASSEECGLVMTGGMDSGSNYLDGVLLTKDGANFDSLPDLPTTLFRHCLVIIDKQGRDSTSTI
jgi:hypothetical protein